MNGCGCSISVRDVWEALRMVSGEREIAGLLMKIPDVLFVIVLSAGDRSGVCLSGVLWAGEAAVFHTHPFGTPGCSPQDLQTARSSGPMVYWIFSPEGALRMENVSPEEPGVILRRFGPEDTPPEWDVRKLVLIDLSGSLAGKMTAGGSAGENAG